MEPDRLPIDLERFEQSLLRGPRAEPSPSHRRRVLDGVRSQLRPRNGKVVSNLLATDLLATVEPPPAAPVMESRSAAKAGAVPILASARMGLSPLSRAALNRLRQEFLRQQEQSKWRLAVAAAATLLLAVGLSWGVSWATGIGRQQSAAAPTLPDVAWQIQQISPGVSEKDSMLQAKVRQSSNQTPSEPTSIAGCLDSMLRAKVRQSSNQSSCGGTMNKLLSELQSRDP
jgi:hypothetical protein